MSTLNELNALVEAHNGNASKAARAMDVPVSTFHTWLDNGRVPNWRVQQLKDALDAVSKGDAA